MTSPAHKSGTDRCAEAIGKIENETGGRIDIIINIQGDEPFIRPEQIEPFAIIGEHDRRKSRRFSARLNFCFHVLMMKMLKLPP